MDPTLLALVIGFIDHFNTQLVTTLCKSLSQNSVLSLSEFPLAVAW
jgi:hypothetical protein